MNTRLICVTFSLLVVFLSLGEGNNEVETKLQPQNAILTRNQDQILQRDVRETRRKKEKTKRNAKKSKPKKKGKHKKNKKNKKRSNVGKSKQKFKKSTNNKTRKNKSLRRKKIRKMRKLKQFQRKMVQKANKCGRQNTTNALDETCLSNLVNSISFERDQVTNFVAQYNRIKNFVKLVGNKAAKKGDFSNSTSTLLEALGGNGSNPACAGQRMTRGSRNAAVDSYKKLSNCSSTIETSCQIPNDTYSPPALDTCNTTYQEIKAKNKECSTKTTQQDNACACWAQAIELVNKAKNSTCDGKKPSDAVRKLKVACISTFSGCKKAEDASIGYIVTCRTCNSSAGECDLTTPADTAANVTTAAAAVTTAAATAGGIVECQTRNGLRQCSSSCAAHPNNAYKCYNCNNPVCEAWRDTCCCTTGNRNCDQGVCTEGSVCYTSVFTNTSDFTTAFPDSVSTPPPTSPPPVVTPGVPSTTTCATLFPDSVINNYTCNDCTLGTKCQIWRDTCCCIRGKNICLQDKCTLANVCVWPFTNPNTTAVSSCASDFSTYKNDYKCHDCTLGSECQRWRDTCCCSVGNNSCAQAPCTNMSTCVSLATPGLPCTTIFPKPDNKMECHECSTNSTCLRWRDTCCCQVGTDNCTQNPCFKGAKCTKGQTRFELFRREDQQVGNKKSRNPRTNFEVEAEEEE